VGFLDVRTHASVEADMQNLTLVKILLRVGVLAAIVIILWAFGLLRVGPGVVH
jgi:uncharacterized membrane protein